MTTTEPAMSEAERSTPAVRAGGDVIERAARVLHAWDVEDGPCAGPWEELTDNQREVWGSGARALADAGLLFDPQREVAWLRKVERRTDERDRARDTADALEAENARLRSQSPCGTCRAIAHDAEARARLYEGALRNVRGYLDYDRVADAWVTAKDALSDTTGEATSRGYAERSTPVARAGGGLREAVEAVADMWECGGAPAYEGQEVTMRVETAVDRLRAVLAAQPAASGDVVERAAHLVGRMHARVLADAGLLADPERRDQLAAEDEEVARLREERDAAREECGHQKAMRKFVSEERDKFVKCTLDAEAARDRARDTAAALEAENARLTAQVERVEALANAKATEMDEYAKVHNPNCDCELIPATREVVVRFRAALAGDEGQPS